MQEQLREINCREQGKDAAIFSLRKELDNLIKELSAKKSQERTKPIDHMRLISNILKNHMATVEQSCKNRHEDVDFYLGKRRPFILTLPTSSSLIHETNKTEMKSPKIEQKNDNAITEVKETKIDCLAQYQILNGLRPNVDQLEFFDSSSESS